MQISFSEILQPAINLAETGFPVHKITSNAWKKNEHVLKRWQKSFSNDLLIAGEAPKVGQIFKNAAFAETLRVNEFLNL